MYSLNYKDIKNLVSSVWSPTTQILECRLEHFSKDKRGYLGTHGCLEILIRQVVNKKCYVRSQIFFVKTPPECKATNEYLFDKRTFWEEEHFYNEVQPLIVKNFKIPKWSPKCYMAQNNMIVLEDMRSQNYGLYPDDELDEQHLRSALSTLARFHGSTILNEKRMGITLKQAYSRAFEEKLFTNSTKIGRITLVGFATIAHLAGKFGLEVNLLPKIYDLVLKLIKTQIDDLNVICHGDLWKNNLLFDKSNPPNCLLVDFQFLRYASPNVDVAMMIYLLTTPAFRRNSEIDMFNHYYSTLYGTITRNKCKIDNLTYEHMLKDYNKRKIVGMVLGCIYLPGILLKSQSLSGIASDAQTMLDWLLGDRSQIIIEHMKDDPIYKEKIKDIITELFVEAKQVFNT